MLVFLPIIFSSIFLIRMISSHLQKQNHPPIYSFGKCQDSRKQLMCCCQYDQVNERINGCEQYTQNAKNVRLQFCSLDGFDFKDSIQNLTLVYNFLLDIGKDFFNRYSNIEVLSFYFFIKPVKTTYFVTQHVPQLDLSKLNKLKMIDSRNNSHAAEAFLYPSNIQTIKLLDWADVFFGNSDSLVKKVSIRNATQLKYIYLSSKPTDTWDYSLIVELGLLAERLEVYIENDFRLGNLELLLANSEGEKNFKQLDLHIFAARSNMSEICIQRFELTRLNLNMRMSTVDFDFYLNISQDGRKSYFNVTYHNSNNYTNYLLSQLRRRLDIQNAAHTHHTFQFEKSILDPMHINFLTQNLFDPLKSYLLWIIDSKYVVKFKSGYGLFLSPSKIGHTTKGLKYHANISVTRFVLRNEMRYVMFNYANLSKLINAKFTKDEPCQVDFIIMTDFWNKNDFFYELNFISCTQTFIMEVLGTKSLVSAFKFEKLNNDWEKFFSHFFIEYSPHEVESDQSKHMKRLKISENKNLFQTSNGSLNLELFQNLEEIDLTLNGLTDSDLKTLILPKQLFKVDLSQNFISKIPNMSQITILRHLNLSSNKIEDLIEPSVLPSGIRDLDLANNLINRISKCYFCDFNKLRTINLSRNFLKVIRDFSFSSNSLRLIDLSFNSIHFLREIDFSNTYVCDLSIRLDFNRMRKLPKITGEIHSISYLGFSSQELGLSLLESDIFATKTKGLVEIKILNLSNNSLWNRDYSLYKLVVSKKVIFSEIDLSANFIDIFSVCYLSSVIPPEFSHGVKFIVGSPGNLLNVSNFDNLTQTNLKDEVSSMKHDCVILTDFEINYMIYFFRHDVMLILNQNDVKYLGGCYLVLLFCQIFTVVKSSCMRKKKTKL
jgi:hypothetical protein